MPSARAIFDSALERPVAERAAYVLEACAKDASLRAKVLELLAAHEGAGSFLCKPTVEAAAPAAAESPGSMIGRYLLLDTLGEGGFGVVFAAEQREPVRRRVALKVIKLGMDTRAVVARFEAERQALALMDHPNIARVLDGGATASGRPYFVMELVAGEPITRYCEKNRLGLPGRLRLFAQVCDAVQHAHTKAIIHRDLKPSNVLVANMDGQPEPKVIDFGIAKAMGAPLTDKTLVTDVRQLVGTPEYMSPEQAGGSEDVDTRSDVYGLGVMLYELLTGATPFDARRLRSAAWDEMLRVIREEEPPRPSMRLTQDHATWGAEGAADRNGDSAGWAFDTGAATRGRTDPASLSRLLRGDLDWIVMKCLEKDRSRRYQTANGLAMDLHRHLAGEPVLAAPPGRVYRIRKFVRRNRVAVVAGTALGAAVLTGLGGTTWGVLWALRERGRSIDEARAAGQQRDKANEIARFMRQMLDGVDPSIAAGRDTTVLREMLDAAARRIDAGELRAIPEAELHLRLTIGDLYRKIGALQAGAAMLAPAEGLARSIHQNAHEDVALSLNLTAMSLSARGRTEEALRMHETALSMRRQISPGGSTAVAAGLGSVAACLMALGRPEEALAPLEEACELRSRLQAEAHPDMAKSLASLGICLAELGRDEEALPRCEAALSISRRWFEGDHPDVARDLGCVGACLVGLNRAGDALPYLRLSLEMYQRLLPGDHPLVATGLYANAACLQSLGQRSDALARFEAALEMRKRLFTDDHPDVAKSHYGLASCLVRAGRAAEGLDRSQSALDMQRRLFGHDHPLTASSLVTRAMCLSKLGRLEEALADDQAALDMRRRLHLGDNAEVALCLNNVASDLEQLGRAGEALAKFGAALEMRQRLFKTDHPDTATSLNNLGVCLRSLGRPAEALPLLQGALAMRERLRKGDHLSVAVCLNNVGLCHEQLGALGEAMANYQGALEMCQRLGLRDHEQVASATSNMANCQLARGQQEEALSNHESVLAMRQRMSPGDRSETARAMNSVAMCLLAQGRAEEAAARQQAALEMIRRVFTGDHPMVAHNLLAMAGCLLELDRPEKAAPHGEAAVAMARRCLQGEHPDLAYALNTWGSCLSACGQVAEALAAAEEALAIYQRALPLDHPKLADAKRRMARELLASDTPADVRRAEAMLRECLPILAQHAGWASAAAEARFLLGEAIAARARLEPDLPAGALARAIEEAEPLLTEGFAGLQAQAQRGNAPIRVRRACRAAERCVKLFEGLDGLDPGKGYDARATEWRGRLEGLRPSAAPSSGR